jgi:hypothetical protein
VLLDSSCLDFYDGGVFVCFNVLTEAVRFNTLAEATGVSFNLINEFWCF